MGKTPEKGTTTVLRYRRKVPVASDEGSAATQSDNQTEHREAEPVAVAKTTTPERVKGGKALDQRPVTHKRVNNGGYVRKKKPNAVVPENNGSAEPRDQVNNGKQVLEAKAVKAKKTQPEEPSNQSSEAVEAASTKTKSKQPQPVPSSNGSFRNRKQHVVNKRDHPSLLKQLMWKAKAVPTPSLETTATTAAPAVNDDEEREYTVTERHHLKLQASKSVQQQSDCSLPVCIEASPVESSSQETQSEDEDLTLLPFQQMEPTEAEPVPVTEAGVFFPTPFSLNKATLPRSVRVHEVLLEDFTFHPQQLRIRTGDVVVWKVSAQTLGMVEHSLEVSLVSGDTTVKASTPPLGGGSSFAWRFGQAGRVDVECSVYQTKGAVIVGDFVKTKKKFEKDRVSTQQRRRKQKQPAPTHHQRENAEPVEEDPVDESRLSVDSESVFHPPADFTLSPEVDAGVCRAVLTQLEEVATISTTPMILIGDVECPLLNDVESSPVMLEPEDKDRLMADELSGTEDEDDVHDDEAINQHDEIEDFQQKIIGMLKRSEERRARQRHSFQQDTSGFDAGAAYDFFKRRFSQVQKEERQIVYAVCPEQQSGKGVRMMDVVSLLKG
ncbi:hypothetical protein Poli38472_013482 [Pythium oligandrum]|uniref:Uncharacterized protein n=1 Tax=Pythium oligandrum TaxID=41045 RepID=A0A8K1C7U6_PYTOL|nr:hypothetical protein Poli38472_013482 [Pythium oligandrum]|eukprot:TMW58008.1 hypothetical protein Poli38472_013482 [Pythium oligandrum]